MDAAVKEKSLIQTIKHFFKHRKNSINVRIENCENVSTNEQEGADDKDGIDLIQSEIFSNQSLLNNSFESSTSDDEQLHFQDLPTECKLKIFSYLTPIERGKSERVCKNWMNVIRCRTLWSEIHFGELFLETICEKNNNNINNNDNNNNANNFNLFVDDSNNFSFENNNFSEFADQQKLKLDKKKLELEQQYNKYKSRVLSFVNYLKMFEPCLKDFSFDFDIGDTQDNWANLMKNVLDSSLLKNLKRASINWKETPAKPSLLQDSSNTWSNSSYSDLIYKHRRRQRSFISFFDYFTLKVSNLEYLSMPFDWSAPSVGYLCRLGSNLKELVLEEYFVPQHCVQALINQLLSSLVNLEKLTLNLVLGSGSGVICHELHSVSLKYLDISKCQGLVLTKVKMPKLEVLITSSSVSYQNQFNSGFDKNLNSEDRKSPQPLTKSYSLISSNSIPQPPPSHPLRSHSSSPTLPPLSLSLPDSPNSQSMTFPNESSQTTPMRRRHSNQLPLKSLLTSSSTTSPSSIPCLYRVLSKGAPNLKKLNDYNIDFTQDARFGCSTEYYNDNVLDSLLRETCICLMHSKPVCYESE